MGVTADTIFKYDPRNSDKKGYEFPVLGHPNLRFAIVLRGDVEYGQKDFVLGLFDYMNMATVELDNEDLAWNKLPPDFFTDYGMWLKWFHKKQDAASLKVSAF